MQIGPWPSLVKVLSRGVFLAESHIFIVFPSLRWTHRVFSWTSFYAPNQMASVLCSVRQTFEGTH